MLTNGQRAVLDLLMEGCSTKEMVDRMGITDKGVQWHRTELYRTLKVKNGVQAVVEAIRRNIVRVK